MPDTLPPQFRLLNADEFDRLSTREKAEYLRKAVEAQKAITAHIDEALARMAKNSEANRK